MVVNGLGIIADFKSTHEKARRDLESWQCEVENAAWATPQALMARFPNTRNIDGKNYVFKICGNAFRLHVKISFKNQKMVIIRIGNHNQYDKWTYDS